MKQRIDYIDRMKGMAIFFVVMGHVYGMVFDQSENITYQWISSFHMPLFMFLSGLVACSGVVCPYWGVRKLGKKLKGLLLPLVVFGMCFTMTFSKDFLTGLIGFLESPNKNGYWYLMTLAVFYVSLSVLCLHRAVCRLVLRRDADTRFGQLEQTHLHAVLHGVCRRDLVYGTPWRDVVLRTYNRLCRQENA